MCPNKFKLHFDGKPIAHTHTLHSSEASNSSSSSRSGNSSRTKWTKCTDCWIRKHIIRFIIFYPISHINTHAHKVKENTFYRFEGNSMELFSRKLIKFEFKNFFYRIMCTKQQQRHGEWEGHKTQAIWSDVSVLMHRHRHKRYVCVCVCVCLFFAFVQTYSSSFGYVLLSMMCVFACVCLFRIDGPTIRNFELLNFPGMESFKKIAWIFEMAEHKRIPPPPLPKLWTQDYKGFCLLTKFLYACCIVFGVFCVFVCLVAWNAQQLRCCCCCCCSILCLRAGN